MAGATARRPRLRVVLGGRDRRLDDLRAATVEDRIAADLELGRHAELIASSQALVRRYPLRERRRHLMLALYRSGDRLTRSRSTGTLGAR